MRASYILPDKDYQSEVKLGLLTTDVRFPSDDCHHPQKFKSLLTKEITRTNEAIEYSTYDQASLWLRLLNFVGIGLDRGQQASLTVRADSIKTTTVVKPTDAFNSLWNQETVQRMGSVAGMAQPGSGIVTATEKQPEEQGRDVLVGVVVSGSLQYVLPTYRHNLQLKPREVT